MLKRGWFFCLCCEHFRVSAVCLYVSGVQSIKQKTIEWTQSTICVLYIPITWRINQTRLWALCVYMWGREREWEREREREREWVSEWVRGWVSTTPASYPGHSQFYHVAHCVLASYGYKEDNVLCHLVEYSPTTHCNNCGVSGEISGWGSCPKKPPVSYSWGIMC